MNDVNKNKKVFEELPVIKSILTMAVPTIISQLIVLIYNMADTFYIGRTNNPYMVAGVSIVFPLFNITIVMYNLAATGSGSLISRLIALNDYDEAKKVSSFSVYFATALALLFSIFLSINLDSVLSFMGASGEVLKYSKQYCFYVLILGAIPTVLTNTCADLLRSVGNSKEAGFGVALGGILNIILDPIFMFILLEKGNEVVGAALATLISNVIAMLFFIIFIMKHKNNSIINFDIRNCCPKKDSIINCIYVGIPSGITTLLFDLDYMILNRLMSSYGNIALAALGIVLKIERLPLNVGIGLSIGVLPLIAYNYSKKNMKRLISLLKTSLIMGVVFAIFSTILYQIFTKGLMQIFIDEPQTVNYGIRFLKARSLATTFMLISFFSVHFFQGCGKGNISFFLAIFRWAIINIPMLFIMNKFYQMNGLIYSQFISDVFVAAVSILVVWLFIRKLKIDC